MGKLTVAAASDLGDCARGPLRGRRSRPLSRCRTPRDTASAGPRRRRFPSEPAQARFFQQGLVGGGAVVDEALRVIEHQPLQRERLAEPQHLGCVEAGRGAKIAGAQGARSPCSRAQAARRARRRPASTSAGASGRRQRMPADARRLRTSDDGAGWRGAAARGSAEARAACNVSRASSAFRSGTRKRAHFSRAAAGSACSSKGQLRSW